MKQLDPKSVWLFFFSFLPRFVILSWLIGFFVGPLMMVVLSLFKENFEMITPGSVFLVFIIPTIFIIFFIFIGSYIWAKLSYKFYKYELADNGFHKESGVIYKSYVTIPYDRIQNIDINRGIVARMLNLSNLQIQTAGSGAINGVVAEGVLPCLSQAIAEQLRDELIQRARTVKSQGI